MLNNAVFLTVHTDTVVKNCVQLLCCMIALKYCVNTVNPNTVFNTVKHPAKQYANTRKTVR